MATKNDNLKEAIELLKQDKKVTRSSWSKHEYAYINPINGQIIDEKRAILDQSLSDFESFYDRFITYSGDTNVFSEYKDSTSVNVSAPIQCLSIDEAAELLKQGKRVSIIEWDSYEYIRMESSGKIVDENNDPYCPSITTLKAWYPTHSTWEERIDPGTSIQEKILRMDKSNNEDMLGYPIIKEIPGRCCKCDSPDEWNSKGKDGKWYCYIHY